MSDAAAALDQAAEFAEFLAFKAFKKTAVNVPAVAAPIARQVRDLWIEWKATLKPVPEYIASHERWFLDFAFPYEGRVIKIGDLPWTDLLPRLGQTWWSEIRKQVKDADRDGERDAGQRRNELLSAGYCNRIRTSASGMFSYHVKLAVKAGSRMRSSRQDDVTENPIKAWPRAESAELGERLGSFNDEQQLNDFLTHAHPVLAKMSILASRCGGMRKTEVRLLRFTWINWERATITLPKEINKNGDSRMFPIDDEAMAILQAQRAACESFSDYVFPNGRGNEPYSDGAMNSWQIAAATSWGQLIEGERPCFHHLRHTWAKWSLIRGMPITQVMEYGGWKSFDVAKKYMKASAAMLEQARQKSKLSVREAIAAHALSSTSDRKAARRARFESAQPDKNRIGR